MVHGVFYNQVYFKINKIQNYYAHFREDKVDTQ